MRSDRVRRRTILAGFALSGTALPAWAQPAPTIGYLTGRSEGANVDLAAAFGRGLAENGFVEGRNVAIEYRSSQGGTDQLPRLAAELVQRGVALLFAASTGSAVAARAATGTIPIIFAGSADPVRLGLVASLNKPGGNITGVSRYGHSLGPKRLQLLLELAPGAATVGILVNPGNPSAAAELQDLQAAATALKVETTVVEARSEPGIDQAFKTLGDRGLRALFMLDDPFFSGQFDRIAALALRHSIATCSTFDGFPRAGGLVSYGADVADVFRQCGVYAGRILKGARPADLPVMLPTRFDLAINLKTARELGLIVPPSILARADEVIE